MRDVQDYFSGNSLKNSHKTRPEIAMFVKRKNFAKEDLLEGVVVKVKKIAFFFVNASDAHTSFI